MFTNKKVLICVCGSVSAYVTAEIVDWLKKNNAYVQVAMTKSATKFVTPLTFQTVSGHPVAINIFATGQEWQIPHIQIAKEVDLIIVLPATATTMAKVVNGLADNIVTAAILAATCPVYFAPTMNSNMYEKVITKKNIETLQAMGYHIIEPAEGTMICGITGQGKMHSAEYLKKYIQNII